MDTDRLFEESIELRALVSVLGTYEAQVAAEHYLLAQFIEATQA